MIYLDHTATMIPDAEIIEYFSKCMKNFPANPASAHSLGYDAKKAQAKAINRLSSLFGCLPEEILITSGGTESINTAIKGGLEANPRAGKRVLISAAEHSAVVSCCKWLSGHGYEVETIPVTTEGIIDLEAFEQALQRPCALISLIYVNNETGAVNPIDEIVRIKNKIQPDCLIHIDGVQAAGKINWQFSNLGVDFFSGSGHKFGSPRGIGWLIHKRGIKIAPIIHGGGQQANLRSGTENVPLIMTMALAAERAFDKIEEKNKYIADLKKVLLEQLSEKNVAFNLISPAGALPSIVNLSVKGLRGETLLHALENQDIFVSTGSACSSKKRGESAVLKAMQVSADDLTGSIRISLSTKETQEIMKETASAIAKIAEWLVKK